MTKNNLRGKGLVHLALGISRLIGEGSLGKGSRQGSGVGTEVEATALLAGLVHGSAIQDRPQ